MISQLIGEKEIQNKIIEIGKQIDQDYNDNLLAVCVLKGAIFFYSDLIRYLSLSPELDFVQASSYEGSRSSRNVQVTKKLGGNLTDKHILIVEDIVDTGYTLKRIIDDILMRKAKSLRVCCLLDRPVKREVDIKPDYIGFEVEESEFLVGCGLDLNDQYRNLPYIGIISNSKGVTNA